MACGEEPVHQAGLPPSFSGGTVEGPSAQTCLPPSQDLAHFWPGDGATLDVVGDDLGCLDGPVPFATGRVGQAFDFVGGILRIPNRSTLESQQFTIEAWVFARSTGSHTDEIGPIIVSKDRAFETPTISYSLAGPGITGRFRASVGLAVSMTDPAVWSEHTFALNTFHHVAMSWDGSELRLYVNGCPEGTLPVGPSTVLYGGTEVGVGRHPLFGARTFDGLIDEVSFFDRALSAVEIQSIYEAGSAGKCASGAGNQAPTADAGDDIAIHAGQTVQLDGTGSFDDDTATLELLDIWSFASRPPGSSAVLEGAGTPTPSFVADLPGTYVVRLVVTDGSGLSSDPDEVVVSSTNVAPTANAGDDRGGVVGFIVSLDGGGSSDPEHDPLTFGWTFAEKPSASVAILAGAATATASFLPDLAGTYVVQLVVSDGFVDSPADHLRITVVSGEEFAENQTMEGLEQVGNLPPSAVTTKGNQQAMTNFLSQAIAAIQAGDLEMARQKLNQAINRTDGCVLRGAPDGSGAGRDWITACADQSVIWDLLSQALDAITP
ncbi:MAG: PKD domain-containing protein [Planctomycetes bacterium]|nr:PKD domain-containing protein [Planctomycetota bacterium]